MTSRLDGRELAAIEDAGLNASATARQRWLDGWLLRFSPGKAKRARCINALAPGRGRLTDRLTLAEQVYAEAGLPMIVRVTPFSAPDVLDDALAAAGLRRFDDTRVMALPDLDPPAAPAWPPGLSLRPLAADAFAHAVGVLRGSAPVQCAAHAERLGQGSVSWLGLALQGADGLTLACGQVALEGALAGLYDVFTAPKARGRGLARTLCTELLGRARHAGARRAYLQVEGDNHAARAIYHRLGFTDAYAYHYRTRDPGAA
jgi:ribosomal protein S18 acetylase RimI-like enzyme